MVDHDNISVAIKFERIKPLYRNGYYGILGVLLACVFIPIFFWDSMSHVLLISWLLAVLLINALRLILIARFNIHLKNGNIVATNIDQWGKIYYIGFFISGMIWATTIFFPFSQDALTGLIFITLVLVGLNSSAIAIYSTSFPLMISYLGLSMVPLAIRFFALQEPLGIALGLMCTIYFLMMFRMIKALNTMIMENIRLKLDNEMMSLQDPLTGLSNRRRLYLYLDKLMPKLIRRNGKLSIVLMDLDGFKQYNDSQGHNAGDILLRAVARILKRESRKEDLAVRYGGEEFLLILPDTTVQDARNIANRIRQTIKKETSATISAGISDYHADMNFEELTRCADIALYQAKAQGKDQVVLFTASTAHIFKSV